jgi:hypothetical protein
MPAKRPSEILILSEAGNTAGAASEFPPECSAHLRLIVFDGISDGLALF